MPVGSRSDLISVRVQEQVQHQALIEVQSHMKRDCRVIKSPCDLETMLYPHTVLFKTSGYAKDASQLVTGSGEGQNLTNMALL